MKIKKMAVYTCIINPTEPFGIHENYDSLKNPKYIEDNLDYICFTNNTQMKSDVYKIKYVDIIEDDPVKTQRKIKLLPHVYLPEYDNSLWLDGTMRLNKKIFKKLKSLLSNYNFVCRKHPKRNCLYEEANLIIDIMKDKKDIIERQVKKYQNLGIPKNNGLIASGVMFRNHKNSEVVETMNTWWEELKMHSHRDQLSFCYAVWKHKTHYKTFGEDFFKEYFLMGHHRIKNGKLRKNY
jgi:hypothetical protein